MADKPASSAPASSSSDAIPMEEIVDAIGKVQYGSVLLVIQGGRIVQIEILEKKRLL